MCFVFRGAGEGKSIRAESHLDFAALWKFLLSYVGYLNPEFVMSMWENMWKHFVNYKLNYRGKVILPVRLFY